MAEISVADRSFCWTDDKGTRKILDFSDLLANKSRISTHRLKGQDYPTISELIFGIVDKAKSENEDYLFYSALTIILLAARLIKTSKPLRVLEYGCGDGWLSVLLAELLGAFHEESILVCASDIMDENCAQWMERMEGLEKLPHLNFLVGDFGKLELPEHSYDAVIINGCTYFDEPGRVLRDAARLAKKGGSLICCADEAPLLESIFKLYFEGYVEYLVGPEQKIMSVNDFSTIPLMDDEIDYVKLSHSTILEAGELLTGEKMCRTDLVSMEEKIRQCIDLCMKAGDDALKNELLVLKEALIQQIVSLSTRKAFDS